jgi:hypothetical protein
MACQRGITAGSPSARLLSRLLLCHALWPWKGCGSCLRIVVCIIFFLQGARACSVAHAHTADGASSNPLEAAVRMSCAGCLRGRLRRQPSRRLRGGVPARRRRGAAAGVPADACAAGRAAAGAGAHAGAGRVAAGECPPLHHPRATPPSDAKSNAIMPTVYAGAGRVAARAPRCATPATPALPTPDQSHCARSLCHAQVHDPLVRVRVRDLVMPVPLRCRW